MSEAERIIAEYEAKFGGVPSFLFMGATPEEMAEALKPCLESGEEYEAPDPDNVY